LTSPLHRVINSSFFKNPATLFKFALSLPGKSTSLQTAGKGITGRVVRKDLQAGAGLPAKGVKPVTFPEILFWLFYL